MTPGPRRPGTRRPVDHEFSDALRSAVEAKGVTLGWLRQRLVDHGNPVSLATLSYWRSGRSEPERLASLDALADLEELLDLEPGDLSSRLGPSRRPGPAPAHSDVRDVVAEQAALVHGALHELQLDGPAVFTEDSLHVVVDVDGDGCVRTINIRAVLRALVDGAQRLPLIYVNDAAAPAPRFSVRGGRLVRDASRLEQGLIAHEFVFDRPARVGEQKLVEQSTTYDGEVRDRTYEHYVQSKVGELLLWVRFDPGRVPARAETFTEVDGDETTLDVGLDATTSVHQVHRRFGPGRAGIRWFW